MFIPFCFEWRLNDERSVVDCEKWDGSSDAPSPVEVADLTATLAACSDGDFSIQSIRGPILIVLLNPHRAFVMWMAEEGDAGKHAIDADGDALESFRFQLANGQVDEFSAFDTVSREAALEAVAHFLKTREASPQLTWRED